MCFVVGIFYEYINDLYFFLPTKTLTIKIITIFLCIKKKEKKLLITKRRVEKKLI